MALWKKIVVGFCVLLVTIVAGGAWFLKAHFSDLCANDQTQVVYSPNKNLKVIVFTRDCGATTGFSTHVSLLKSSQNLENEGGNLFAADFDRTQQKSAAPSPQVSLRWLSNTQLEIQHSDNIRTFRKVENDKGVHVVYVPRNNL